MDSFTSLQKHAILRETLTEYERTDASDETLGIMKLDIDKLTSRTGVRGFDTLLKSSRILLW